MKYERAMSLALDEICDKYSAKQMERGEHLDELCELVEEYMEIDEE